MKRTALISSAAMLAIAGISVADTAPAVSSPTVLSAVEAGQPMRMVYELEAKARIFFIPATGKAVFKTEMRPDQTYSIDSKVKVTGIADWFVNYDMTLRADGIMRDNELKSRAYSSQNKDGKKNRKVKIAFTDTDFKMVANPVFGNLGDPAATTAQVMNTNDPITALITFALEPRAPGADPCGGPIRIFDGRQLTYLILENAGTKNIKTKGWEGTAIECHVTMDKIAGYKKGEADNDNLTALDGPLRMFLAPMPNGTTVPVKIVADSKKIGKVTLSAKKLRFEPIEPDAALTNGG